MAEGSALLKRHTAKVVSRVRIPSSPPPAFADASARRAAINRKRRGPSQAFSSTKRRRLHSGLFSERREVTRLAIFIADSTIRGRASTSSVSRSALDRASSTNYRGRRHLDEASCGFRAGRLLGDRKQFALQSFALQNNGPCNSGGGSGKCSAAVVIRNAVGKGCFQRPRACARHVRRR